jgi:hypothetical protein
MRPVFFINSLNTLYIPFTFAGYAENASVASGNNFPELNPIFVEPVEGILNKRRKR